MDTIHTQWLWFLFVLHYGYGFCSSCITFCGLGSGWPNPFVVDPQKSECHCCDLDFWKISLCPFLVDPLLALTHTNGQCNLLLSVVEGENVSVFFSQSLEIQMPGLLVLDSPLDGPVPGSRRQIPRPFPDPIGSVPYSWGAQYEPSVLDQKWYHRFVKLLVQFC